MEKSKIYSLLVLLVIGYSTLFSQQDILSNLSEYDGIHSRSSEAIEKLDNHNLEYLMNPKVKFNSNLNREQFNILGTADVIDSVVITIIDSSIKKHIFTYDNYGYMTSDLSEYWDNAEWVKSSRLTYTYDNNGNKTSDLCEKWSETNWVNFSYRTCTYDNNGNMTSDLYQLWGNINWVNSYLHTYSYDGNGNTISDLHQHWDGTNWVNLFHTTYTYNDNGNETSFLDEEWHGTNWVTLSQATYTYDSEGNMTFGLYYDIIMGEWRSTSTYDNNGDMISYLSEIWDGTNWQNSSHTTYSYNSNGDMISFLYEYWDGSDWKKSSRGTYTYDNNWNKTSYLLENWNETNWVNLSLETYTYDNNGNKISYLYQSWDGSFWVNSFHHISSYNSNGNIVSYLSENWDGTNWTYGYGSVFFQDTIGNRYNFSGAKIEIIYKTITEVGKENNNNFVYALQQNYPNPFNPSTIISYSLPKTGFVQLKVYDLLGREVANLVNKEQVKGNYKVSFNASNLSSGIYFYQLQSGSFSDTKKLILLR